MSDEDILIVYLKLARRTHKYHRDMISQYLCEHKGTKIRVNSMGDESEMVRSTPAASRNHKSSS